MSKEKVWLLEDDKVCAMLYKMQIDALGYEVVHHLDGSLVLSNEFEAKIIPAVVTDIEMKPVNGFEVVERLAEIGWNKPCIVQSGRATKIIAEKYGSVEKFKAKFPFVKIVMKGGKTTLEDYLPPAILG